MGRGIRIVGLCLVVAFALSAATATGAEASTEFVKRCFKVVKGADRKYHGHYSDKNCTKEASPEEISLGGTSNKYEFGFGENWFGKGKGSKGKPIKLVSGNWDIQCVKSGGSGTVIGPMRVEATFRFAGCVSTDVPSFCTTPGHKNGEIETKQLLGVVGENAGREVFVSFTAKETGSTEPAPGETFAEFGCVEGRVQFSLHGTLSGRWTEAVNKTTKVGGVEFADGLGEQGLIAHVVPGNEPPVEEAVTLEAAQSFKFKADYELTQN